MLRPLMSHFLLLEILLGTFYLQDLFNSAIILCYFLSATTHSDIVLRARLKGVTVEIVHNASIMSAIACCGLQVCSNPRSLNYNRHDTWVLLRLHAPFTNYCIIRILWYYSQLYSFGETVTIPFWDKYSHATSFLARIESNFTRGLHTLCLLGLFSEFHVIFNLYRISYFTFILIRSQSSRGVHRWSSQVQWYFIRLSHSHFVCGVCIVLFFIIIYYSLLLEAAMIDLCHLVLWPLVLLHNSSLKLFNLESPMVSGAL